MTPEEFPLDNDEMKRQAHVNPDGIEDLLDYVDRPDILENVYPSRAAVEKLIRSYNHTIVSNGSGVTMGGGEKIGRPHSKTLAIVLCGNEILALSVGMSGDCSLTTMVQNTNQPTPEEIKRVLFVQDSPVLKEINEQTAKGPKFLQWVEKQRALQPKEASVAPAQTTFAARLKSLLRW